MDQALLGTEPPELAVVREPAPHRRRVHDQLLHLAPDDQRRELLDRCAAEVVAGTDRERHADALVLTVGLEEHVGTGVVRVRVHGIRTGQCPRGGRPNVERSHASDPRHGGAG